MKSNPWKGLVSYEEKDLEKYEFCGRTKAISKYYSLITNSLISTLYGKTGCGKTSMLQAGIFPLLRQESYFPVMCRLSLRNENVSFSDYLIERVEQEIIKLGFLCTESNVPVNQVDNLEKYRLWKYFYGHEFHGKDEEVVFPVIVLDQFEEILINSKNDSSKFLEQVSFLVGDDLLLPDDCYANFRVTISLREDFLYLLEDAIDEGKLQGLRDNRMRLTPLSIEEAEEVISLGDDFFKHTDRKQIYKSICNLAGNRRGHISTNMLSLICSQIYHLYSEKQGKELVTIDEIKQLSEDPLRDFYRNSIKGLKEETTTFIENNLVSNGFRKPVTKQEFETRVPVTDREKLTSGETKILQFITANDNDCVELIHDTLARTVFGVTEEKKRIAKSKRLLSIPIETLFCIIVSLAIIFDVIVTGTSAGIALVGILLIVTNLLYSLASFGYKMVSKKHFVLVWLFNITILFIAIGENLLDNASPLPYFLLIYLFFIPIINLIRQNHSEVKLGFGKTFKYVFFCETIKEDNNKIIGYLSPLSIVFVIGVGFLSGFFMSSWCLWVLLPIGSALCYHYIKHTIVKPTYPDNPFSFLLPVMLSLCFVTVQHIAFYHIFLNCVIFLLFLVWAIISGIQQKDITPAKRTAFSFLIFVVCGLILPILYLGYNPLAKEFENYARNWSQPKINSSISVPLLAFHNEEGMNGLADRHQIIFDAKFMHVDSVNYEFYDWDGLKKYCDYGLLSKYINDDVQNYSDIILYTKTGIFRWKDMFSHRGNSLYLTTRINTIEENPCNNWTEEEFNNIAELSAGYRIIGRDSLANSLEVLYFLRRMMQADIYQCVDSKFTTNATTCENMMDYFLHKRVDPDFEGYYTKSFITNADLNVTLKRRIDHYLDIADGGFTQKYKRELQSKAYKRFNMSFKDSTIYLSLKDVAKIDADVFLKLLNSYKNDILSFKWANEAIGNCEDMLYQTRNTLGRYVVDSIYAHVYEDEFYDDVRYNNASAWHNLFLCRFALAEKYARKAIECAKEDYITESTTRYITYTNLITSLFLQGKTTESFDLVRKMKDCSIGKVEGDWWQLLFPIQAAGMEVSVGEGVCQDFNHFIRVGILNDSTTTEFREIRRILYAEYSLPSDQGHFIYLNGWNLSMMPDSLYLFYKNEQERLPLIKTYDINVKDSVAICHMVAGGYRFLDLSKMQFIGETYNYAWHFSEGLAAIEENNHIGFINRQGQIEIPCQFPSESWLRTDHYRLAFHNGKASVTNEMNYYNLIDRAGNWVWDGCSFPYVKWYGDGMIISQMLDWVYTDSDGIIQGKFDSEIDELFFNTSSLSYVPIFNHFDVSDIKHAEDLPNLDVSGIWYCNTEESYLYLGKNTSQYMWSGKKNDSGYFYLSIDGASIKVHMCSDKVITKKLIEIDSDIIYIGDLILVKVKSL